MLQCRKCKRAAPELAKFCGHCGGRVCAPPPPPRPVKKKKMQFDIDSRLSFTVAEGAELMGISKGMLYEQIKRGNIAFISLGSRS